MNSLNDSGAQVKDVTVTADPANRLPSTGTNTGPMLVLGGAFLVVGGLLLAARRRMPAPVTLPTHGPTR